MQYGPVPLVRRSFLSEGHLYILAGAAKLTFASFRSIVLARLLSVRAVDADVSKFFLPPEQAPIPACRIFGVGRVNGGIYR